MGDTGTPAWVVNVREEIGRSPAWEVLSDQVYARVCTILRSHGLGHFSDLSSPEQITLLEEAHRDIMSEDNKVYQAFESQFSKSMDAEIAREARARVDKHEGSKNGHTDEALYLDSILDAAAQGAVSLLKELPREHLGSLRLMLNQAVPSRARLDVWRLLLKHTAVREEYELLMKQNRNSTISGQDIYITHRCQALLESGSVAARRLLPLTSRNVVLMKTVLSYHHACKMTKRGEKATVDVPDSFLHFLVPLCAVATRGAAFSSSSSSASSSHNATAIAGATAASAAASSGRKEHKIEVMIEDLVEMFEAALEAGLEGFLDPHELGIDGGGGGNGKHGIAGSGGAGPNRAKKVAKELKTAPVAEASGGGDGPDGSVHEDNGAFPAWVDKIFGSLVPGFQGLVDHVTRVHLGLAVAASAAEVDGVEDRQEGGASCESAHTEGPEAGITTEQRHQAVGEHQQHKQHQHQQQQQQQHAREKVQPDDHNATGSQQRRRASSTRRCGTLLSQSQERPASAENDIGSPSVGGDIATAGGSDPSGGEENNTTRETRRRSSSLKLPPQAEGPDGKDKPSLSRSDATTEVPPLPHVSASQARAALHALCSPLVRVGLVGHLGADATLFAWDQAVVAGFGVMVPRVAAMVVAAAADKLEACATFAVMSEALFSRAHLISISQLQELMEVHCMPSIRKEMRVSHKLSPEIVGPTLQTATQILDSAYSRKTREKQQARKAHVDHILGPSKGCRPNRAEGEDYRLDLSRSPAAESDGSTGGGGIRNAERNGGDNVDDDHDDDDSDRTESRASKGRGGRKGGKGAGDQRQDKEVGGNAKRRSERRGVEPSGSDSGAVDEVETAKTIGGNDDSARGKTSREGKSGKRLGRKDLETAATAAAAVRDKDPSAVAIGLASKKVGHRRVGAPPEASNVEKKTAANGDRKTRRGPADRLTTGTPPTRHASEDSNSADHGEHQYQHRNSRRRSSTESSRGSRRRSSSSTPQQPKRTSGTSEHKLPRTRDRGERADQDDGGEGSVARSPGIEHGRGGGRRGPRPRPKSLAESSASFDESSGAGDGQAGADGEKGNVGGGDKRVAAEGATAMKQRDSNSSDGRRRKRSSNSRSNRGARGDEVPEKGKEGAGKAIEVKPKRKGREGGKSKNSATPSAAPPNAAEVQGAEPAASASPLRRLLGAFGGTKKAPTNET